MLETREHIAREIRVALARKGITQARLAEVVQMTPNTLSTRMTGQRPFTGDELYSISVALDIAFADLFPATGVPS